MKGGRGRYSLLLVLTAANLQKTYYGPALSLALHPILIFPPRRGNPSSHRGILCLGATQPRSHSTKPAELNKGSGWALLGLQAVLALSIPSALPLGCGGCLYLPIRCTACWWNSGCRVDMVPERVLWVLYFTDHHICV